MPLGRGAHASRLYNDSRTLTILSKFLWYSRRCARCRWYSARSPRPNLSSRLGFFSVDDGANFSVRRATSALSAESASVSGASRRSFVGRSICNRSRRSPTAPGLITAPRSGAYPRDDPRRRVARPSSDSSEETSDASDASAASVATHASSAAPPPPSGGSRGTQTSTRGWRPPRASWDAEPIKSASGKIPRHSGGPLGRSSGAPRRF